MTIQLRLHICLHITLACSPVLNTLIPRKKISHLADDTFKHIFLNENVRIYNTISPNFVPDCPINNIPALVQIMAWRRPGDKPLSAQMIVRLPTYICFDELISVFFRYVFLQMAYIFIHECVHGIRHIKGFNGYDIWYLNTVAITSIYTGDPAMSRHYLTTVLPLSLESPYLKKIFILKRGQGHCSRTTIFHLPVYAKPCDYEPIILPMRFTVPLVFFHNMLVVFRVVTFLGNNWHHNRLNTNPQNFY